MDDVTDREQVEHLLEKAAALLRAAYGGNPNNNFFFHERAQVVREIEAFLGRKLSTGSYRSRQMDRGGK